VPVLIGHALGSVVACEYLRQQSGESVDMLLTLGSPLALHMVRDRLQVCPLAAPAWVNVRDTRDPVTCGGGPDRTG
jgi:alpha-beta hydrolase superfamily lysophospholipase